MNRKKKRMLYLLATLLLLIMEVWIALFIHDNVIRPYFGDVLVVIVIYTFIRFWIPDKMRLLPLYVFLFSICVELLQAVDIVHVLGLENNHFLSILIGSVFDVKDIICYGAGCVGLGIYEYVIWKRRNEIKFNNTRWCSANLKRYL